MTITRGDIFYADLSPVIGSEQGGIRPIIIVQNDIGNKYSPTIIAAAVTSQINKAKLPTHIEISADEYGLPRNSVVLLEQIRTIDKIIKVLEPNELGTPNTQHRRILPESHKETVHRSVSEKDKKHNPGN